jgi:hypothetical protein
MKKFILFFVLLALPINLLLAQTADTIFTPPPPPQNIDISILNNKENGKDVIKGSSVEISQINFEDKVYSAGDNVKITLNIKNNDNVDYSNLSFDSNIVVFSSSTKVLRNYGYQNVSKGFFLPKNASKQIDINFKLPQSISFKDGDEIKVEVSLSTNIGENIGFTSKEIKLGNFLSVVDIVDVYVKANDQEYSVQEGPTVDKNENLKLAVKLLSSESSEITLTPVLKVYNQQTTGPEVAGKTYDKVVLKSNEEKLLELDLPTFDKGGVYAFELNFLDDKNVSRTVFVPGRYIVAGDMVTIPSVTINKTKFSQGENAVVEVTFTGAPVNIDTGTTTKVGNGIIKVNLFDQKNNLIASSEKEVNFDTLRDTATFEIPMSKNISVARTSVVVTKDGVELTNYSAQLSEGDNQEMPISTIIILVSILVVMIAIVVLLAIKVKKSIVLSVFFALISIFGFYGGANAEGAYWTNQFYASGVLSSRNFTPGAAMHGNIYNQTQAQVCTNAAGTTLVSYLIYDASGNLVGNYYAQNYDPRHLAENSGRVSNRWRSFNGFYPHTANQAATGVWAPWKPGYYTLVQSISQYANYRQPGRAAGDVRGSIGGFGGPVNLYFGFTVTCPAGQTPGANGFCVPTDQTQPTVTLKGINQTTKPNIEESHLVWKPGDSIIYKWVTTGATQISSTFSRNAASVGACTGGTWTVSTANGYPLSGQLPITTTLAAHNSIVGCVYDVLLSAYNANSLKGATATLKVSVVSNDAQPTLDFTANGRKNLIFYTGQTINYAWSSTNADSITDTYTSSASKCGPGGPWNIVKNRLIASYLNPAASAASEGCKWTVTLIAKNTGANKTAQSVVTLEQKPAAQRIIDESNGGCTAPLTQCITSVCSDSGLCGKLTYSTSTDPSSVELKLIPAIVNSNQKCTASWTLEKEDATGIYTCRIYNSAGTVVSDADTATDFQVNPGEYKVKCTETNTNIISESSSKKCVLNPTVIEI